MADRIDYEFTGIEELLGKLDEVSDDIKIKGGRFALRKAAQKLRDQVKMNADRVDDPESDARISDNVVERFSARLFKRTGNLGFRVGVMGGAGGNKPAEAFAGLPGGDTRHWRFLEFGTAKMPAKPFMRPAIDQAGQDIVNEFSAQYIKALDRAIKRARRGRA